MNMKVLLFQSAFCKTSPVQEIQKENENVNKFSTALEKVAAIPFVHVASEATDAKFVELLQEAGLEDAKEFLGEDGGSLVLLSKLGAAREKAKTKAEGMLKKVTCIDVLLFAWKRDQEHQDKRSKLKALEKLDPEKCAQKQQKTNKRRRMRWNQKCTKKDVKKRIQETFEGMSPVRKYRKQVSIQEKLEVVRWCNKFLEGKKGEEQADEEHEAEDAPLHMQKKKRQKRNKKKKQEAEEEEANEKPEAAQPQRTKQRKCRQGIHILKLAQKEFPELVGPNTSLGRWAKQAQAQHWEEIPERVRKEHRELPDVWKQAVGNDRMKGQKRFKKVPSEVLKALDEHMVLVCRGLSDVTERNEEVMIREIALTSGP